MHNSRYVDHLANCLKQKVDVADKMVASQEAVRQRSIEAAEEAKTLQPKLQLIIAKTKELQGEVRCDVCIKLVEKEGALTGASTQTVLNSIVVGKLRCTVSLCCGCSLCKLEHCMNIQHCYRIRS